MSNSGIGFVTFSGCEAVNVHFANHDGAVDVIGSGMGKTMTFEEKKTMDLPSIKRDEAVSKNYPKPQTANGVNRYEKVDSELEYSAGQELEDGRIVSVGNLKFVIDATGSMAPFIIGAKEQVFEVVKNHEKNLDEIYEKLFPGKNFKHIIRVSVVGYRDYCDKVKLEVLPFTTDIEYVKYFLGNLCASGGGDLPEDMLSGFKEMIMQDVGENNQFTNNLVCLITDAPAHGSFMKEDNIAENGNYEHEKDQWVSVLLKMKDQNHDLMVVKAGSSVNKTLEFMKSHYDEEGKFAIIVKDLTKIQEETYSMPYGIGGDMLSSAVGAACNAGSSESGLMYYTRNSGIGFPTVSGMGGLRDVLKGIEDLNVASSTLNPTELKIRLKEMASDEEKKVGDDA